jgi:Ca2+-binding EF-hand superfamily protein
MIAARVLAGFFMIAWVAACAGHDKPTPTFSPNGEPLMPPQWPVDCEEAVGLWFDRLDASHTGKVSLAQLMADAERQYRKMDLRHDGKVTAEELSKYRLSVMGGHYLSISTPGQKNTLTGRDPDDDPNTSDLDRAFGDPTRHNKDDDSHKRVDAYAAMVTDQPDPVMTADTDLDGSVTWDEFRALVAQNFADFDKDHAGWVTKSEVQESCAHMSGKP